MVRTADTRIWTIETNKIHINTDRLTDVTMRKDNKIISGILDDEELTSCKSFEIQGPGCNLNKWAITITSIHKAQASIH